MFVSRNAKIQQHVIHWIQGWNLSKCSYKSNYITGFTKSLKNRLAVFHTTITVELNWNEPRISEKDSCCKMIDCDTREEKLTIQVQTPVINSKITYTPSNHWDTNPFWSHLSMFPPGACRGTSQSGSDRQINSFAGCGLVCLPQIISSHDRPVPFAKSGGEGKYQKIIWGVPLPTYLGVPPFWGWYNDVF